MCNAMKLCFILNFFSVVLGDVTKTYCYIMNLFILRGERFSFKAAGVDCLNQSV